VVIRVVCAHVQQGTRLVYVSLCKNTTIPRMRTHPGYLAYRICDSHPRRPDDVVVATLWEDEESVQRFIQTAVGGVNWDAGTALLWETGVVVNAVVSYVDDDYRSLAKMGDAVAPFVQRRKASPWSLRLTDAQWLTLAPILDSVGARQSRRGRPRVDNRPIFDAILGVIATGSYWREVTGGVAAATAWRRFNAWEGTGVWERAWRILLSALDSKTRQDLVLALLDCAHAPVRRP
jgi:transposase/heme-degrading monooxygenase HmoA